MADYPEYDALLRKCGASAKSAVDDMFELGVRTMTLEALLELAYMQGVDDCQKDRLEGLDEESIKRLKGEA